MSLETPYANLLPPLTTDEYAALEADIAVNGVMVPITIDEIGNILDGHNRYAIEPNAPTVTISGLTEGEKIAYVYRANNARRNLSPTQKKKLREDMKGVALFLKQEGKTQAEIGALLGVDQSTVSLWLNIPNMNIHNGNIPDARVTIPKAEDEKIVARVEAGETQEQVAADYGVQQAAISKRVKKAKKKAAREPKPAIVEASKSPRLLVGRAEKLELDNESIDLIITSPPYNLESGQWPMGGNGRVPRTSGIGYDDDIEENDYQAWQINVLIELYRVAKQGASLFYNHKPRNREGALIHPLAWILSADNPWTLRQEIIWDRGSTHNHSPALFWPEDERVYWLTKGKPKLPDRPIGISTVWRFHGPVADTWHPAPFAEELPRRCIDAVGREGITVLDPFAGSCTVARVALTYNYDAVAVDISEEYLLRAAKENGWKYG